MRPLLVYIMELHLVSATIAQLGSKSYIFRSRRSSTEKPLNSVQILKQHPWKAIYGERSVEIRSVGNKENSIGNGREGDLDELRSLTASRLGDDKTTWSETPGIMVQTELEVGSQEAASRRASQNPV